MAAVLAAGVLACAGSGLLAELVGGLALVPLAMMAYLMLLPVESDGWGGGGGRGDERPDGPMPDHGPDGAIDWADFEREFWAHVERQGERVQV